MLGQLPTGAHLVIPDDCYQGVAGIAEAGARDHGWTRRAARGARHRRLGRRRSRPTCCGSSRPPTRCSTSPTSPPSAPRRASPGTRIVVDNTFATPLLQQPLALGADIVIHAATKFLGGHSDLLMGVAVAEDAEQRELLRTARKLNGATPGRARGFLAPRGLRTLPVRLKRRSPARRCWCSGWARTRPCTASATRASARSSASSSPTRETVDRACAATKVIWHATSLGGVETTMERRSVHPGQEHIPAGLIRMSVGCEDVEDLWADLDAALLLASDLEARDERVEVLGGRGQALSGGRDLLRGGGGLLGRGGDLLGRGRGLLGDAGDL